MSDLLDDLKADLAPPPPAPPAPAAPAPTAAAPAPAAAEAPRSPASAAASLPAGRLPLPHPPVRRTTPALELTVTPLRWALPGLALDRGLRLRVGPVQVGLTRR